MNNWKKWIAGVCALSLCLTATALPASAEGEEDIDLIGNACCGRRTG